MCFGLAPKCWLRVSQEKIVIQATWSHQKPTWTKLICFQVFQAWANSISKLITLYRFFQRALNFLEIWSYRCVPCKWGYYKLICTITKIGTHLKFFIPRLLHFSLSLSRTHTHSLTHSLTISHLKYVEKAVYIASMVHFEQGDKKA